MRKTVKYTDSPIKKFTVIKDFLPSPSELVFKNKQQKVTINLNQTSVDFFKQIAKEHHTPYQRVIRSVLDNYVGHFTASH